MLLGHHLNLLLDRGDVEFQAFNRTLLIPKPAPDDKRGWNEFGLVLLLADNEIGFRLILFALVVNDQPWLRRLTPTITGDEVAIVLHSLSPVVHEVLIYVVPIKQWRIPEGGEQILGNGFYKHFGTA